MVERQYRSRCAARPQQPGRSRSSSRPRSLHGASRYCTRLPSARPQAARVDTRQRLLATEQRDALEDARRDRRAGRSPRAKAGRRLAACTPRARAPPPSASAHRRLRRSRRARRAPRARRRAPRGRPRPATAPAPLASSTGRSKMNPASGQKSASVWIFSWLIATARSKRSSSRTPGWRRLPSRNVPDEPDQLCERQLADVDAVRATAASISSKRAGLRLTRSQREALDQLVRSRAPSASSPAPQPSSAR